MLWLIAELGEVIDIVKRDGTERIMTEDAVRTHMVEELCDVLMYFNDVMLCYGITPEELKEEYVTKHNRNMNRW